MSDTNSAATGKLNGKVAIVTGAAQGTGEAIARRFVAEGAQVLIADVRVEQGEAVARELGPAAEFVELDVGNEAALGARGGACRAALRRHRHPDQQRRRARDGAARADDLADYERVVRVNQIGPFLGMRAVVPGMKRRGGGSIVNIGSTDGVFPGDQGLIAYGASKWALRGMTKIAAVELGRHGIRVNVVNPTPATR